MFDNELTTNAINITMVVVAKEKILCPISPDVNPANRNHEEAPFLMKSVPTITGKNPFVPADTPEKIPTF